MLHTHWTLEVSSWWWFNRSNIGSRHESPSTLAALKIGVINVDSESTWLVPWIMVYDLFKMAYLLYIWMKPGPYNAESPFDMASSNWRHNSLLPYEKYFIYEYCCKAFKIKISSEIQPIRKLSRKSVWPKNWQMSR